MWYNRKRSILEKSFNVWKKECHMWKIKHIFDGEYGCEELTEGQRPKVSVTLINEKEEETCFSVEDSWLTEHGLNEGDLWPKEDEFL
jgi:hypothetical protein